MKIDDLSKKLEKAKKTWNTNLDIYVEMNFDEDCPTCGEPKSRIYDGFPDHTTVMSIDSKPTFVIVTEKNSERPK